MTDNPQNNIGGQLGSRLSSLLSQALITTSQRMGPQKAGVAQTVLADFTNHVSDEVRSVMGPIFRSMAESEDAPPELKPLLHALGNSRGQAWAWIGGTATGAALGAGLIDLLNNLLAPVIQPAIAADPNSTLSPQTAADAQIRGFGWTGERNDLEYDAQAGGIDRKRWLVMQKLSQARPTPNDIREMVNRKYIDIPEAMAQMKTLGYSVEDAKFLLGFRDVFLTPETLAQMLNRDILDVEEARFIAERQGVSNTDMDRMALLGGDPLPVGDLAVAFRRGIINRARFEKGVIQGPLRKEWFDVLEELQFSRMSTVDAASAVTQGHLTLDQGKRVAHENGLEPDDFGTLIEIAGRPPGLDFATEALNRGEISPTEFRKMFLESSIKNQYLDLMYRMRIRLIPQETARLLYRNGVYTEDQALDTLLKHGFSLADATALLALEKTREDTSTKELTRSQIVDMYEERLLSLNDTVESLIGLGYSEDDAHSMVELADLQRLRKFINSAVTKVKSAYVAGRISEIEASSTLDALGIPNEMRDELFALWDIERTTISKTLTAAQIRQALKKDLITGDDALARLIDQGYDQIDAELYLQLTA